MPDVDTAPAEQTANGQPTDPELKPKQVRHPTALHIPDKLNVAWSARGFPWRAVGYRIILMMLQGEERTSAGGIVLPDVAATGRGKQKDLTVGVCVAYGAGEPVPHVGYLSPEHDYGVKLGAVIFIEPNSGIEIQDDDNEYRVITPHDIVMVLRSDAGKETRKRMVDRAEAALNRYQANTGVIHGTAKTGATMPDRPAYEQEIGEARERMRREAGAATKTQVSMSGAYKNQEKSE